MYGLRGPNQLGRQTAIDGMTLGVPLTRRIPRPPTTTEWLPQIARRVLVRFSDRKRLR